MVFGAHMGYTYNRQNKLASIINILNFDYTRIDMIKMLYIILDVISIAIYFKILGMCLCFLVHNLLLLSTKKIFLKFRNND